MLSAVIFDLDGTLTRTPNPWQHIHECLGVWSGQAAAHLGEWLSGKIPYDEFCRKDSRLWRGRPLAEIESYLDSIEVNRHVPEVVGALVKRRIPSIIISSGFSYVAHKIEVSCKWDPLLIYANELIEGPDIDIRVSADWSSSLSKKALAEKALRMVGAEAAATLVVSDATRDLEQLKECGFHLHVREEDDLRRTLHYLD